MIRKISSICIAAPKQKTVSTDMNFIAQTAFLGLCQGFHQKMIEDTIQNIYNLDGITYKQKKREISRMYKSDPLITSAVNVKTETAKVLSNFECYIGDEDLKKVWLIIDRFLLDHMLKNTFIAALGTFSLIANDLACELKSNAYDDLQEKLYKMANTLSDEYYEHRKDLMTKADKEYDRFVFSFFEDSELTQAKKAGESFLGIFAGRDTFDKYANDYFESLSNQQKEYFISLFNGVNNK